LDGLVEPGQLEPSILSIWFYPVEGPNSLRVPALRFIYDEEGDVDPDTLRKFTDAFTKNQLEPATGPKTRKKTRKMKVLPMKLGKKERQPVVM
jgi:hypothetical protein